mgnify:CR=1 FL=1
MPSFVLLQCLLLALYLHHRSNISKLSSSGISELTHVQRADSLDGVIGSQANPMRDRLVLLGSDGESSFRSEGLLGRLIDMQIDGVSYINA